MIAQLDAHLDLLRAMPGSPGGSRSRSLGVLGERAGEMAVLVGGHINQHEETLASLPAEERSLLEDASATVRKARQSVPVAFGRRREGDRD